MPKTGRALAASFLLSCPGFAALAQTDPGPRPGPASAGGPLAGLRADEEKLFWAAWQRFKEVYSVSGTIEHGAGLGPGYNGNACAQCHAQPSAGGSSPGPTSPQVRRVTVQNQRLALAPEQNPQLTLASLDRVAGGVQEVPPFLRPEGPVRVARFIRKQDGTADGDVHDIYTIAGRRDAPGCALAQPDFAAELARGNVAFRIPTPTFGAGLIEAVPDSTLLDNFTSTASRRQELGIAGHFNRSANGGTISRFGWKAQNDSLLIFSAESFNVEMGVTSEVFPSKRNALSGCAFNPTPEDRTNVQPRPNDTFVPSGFASDVANVAAFMRLSAPPAPATHTESELNGRLLFSQIGCALCHSPSLRTGASAYGGMSGVMIHPYSDFALHRMGAGLADHISQGLAAGDEFRTAPLWGLGQRMFFLHDGRTSDLLVAITAHAGGSEADAVVAKFAGLSLAQKQDVLDFLRSL